MSRKSTLRWLSLVVTLTTFLGDSLTTAEKSWNKKHYVKRNTGQQSLESSNRFDIRSMVPSQWQMYAPSPPSPEEVDCYIEVEVTELVGGRCVRLGGYGTEEGPAVCQSGIHLDIWNNECEQVMQARQNSGNSQETGQNEQEAGEATSSVGVVK